MSVLDAEIWKGSGFRIERAQSEVPGKLVLNFSGPLTTRSMYSSMSSETVRSILDLSPPPGEMPVTIFDLTGVPYMDSMGVGFIVREYTRCKGRGIRLIAAGASSHVLDLFRLTKVDSLIPLVPTIQDALAQ